MTAPKDVVALTLESINRSIEQLRSKIDEPVLLQINETVQVEVRPVGADDRISVIPTDSRGFTCVNYTSEGVIIDVVDEAADIVSTLSLYNEDLQQGEDE